jgi:hypothetical protein
MDSYQKKVALGSRNFIEESSKPMRKQNVSTLSSNSNNIQSMSSSAQVRMPPSGNVNNSYKMEQLNINEIQDSFEGDINILVPTENEILEIAASRAFPNLKNIKITNTAKGNVQGEVNILFPDGSTKKKTYSSQVIIAAEGTHSDQSKMTFYLTQNQRIP